MSKTNKKVMGLIRRKLTRCINLYWTSCGHDARVSEADHVRWELERMIEEALEQKGGVES